MAQDTITLVSGKRVRGEVIHQGEKEVEVVTRAAKLLVIPKSDVAEIKMGKPIRKSLAAQIKGKELDPDALLAAAEWGSDTKSLKKDCLRLARRALALEPDFAKARRYLGQVRFEDTWYKNQKEADKALAKKMRASGFVFVRGAWVAKSEKGRLKRSPGLFMLDGRRKWRLTDELMKERKMLPWKGDWYKPQEKLLVDELRRFEELTGSLFQGAQHGPTTVVISGRRGEAERILSRIRATRKWFDETFKPKGETFVAGPSSLIVILRDRPTYLSFLKRGGAIHGADANRVAYGQKHDSMSFGPLSRVSCQAEPLWEHTLISGTGATMMRLWGHIDFDAAPVLYVAAGHLAEIRILGEIRIHFAKADGYDRVAKTTRKYRSLKEAKKLLQEALKDNKVIGLSRLFKTSLGGLTAVHEAQGLFLLQYLKQTNGDGLRVFVQDRGPGEFAARFLAAFKITPEKMQEEFWRWFEDLQ